MDTSYEEEEITPLVSRPGIPTAVPDRRQPYEKKLAVYIILTSILFERIAFYTLVSNLSSTLEPMIASGKLSTSSINPFIFFGTSYISTIIFAIMSDAKLGRFKTIIIGFGIYLIGYTSAILTTIPKIYNCTHYISNITCGEDTISHCEGCRLWVIGTFIIIAIGAGAVESNMAVIGAEQIQPSNIASRYFDKYIVAVNIGGIIATLASVYSPRSSNDDASYYQVPFIIATSTLLLAAVLFLLGHRYYIHVNFEETVITQCIPVIINAFQSRKEYEKKLRLIERENGNSGLSNLLNASHSLADEDRSIRIDHHPTTFLDFAKVPNGKFHDRIVDDVKSLRGAIVVFALLIPYWLIYNQLSSTFPAQANYMHGSNEYMVTYMWLGDPVTIIIGLFIFNIFLYKFIDTRKKPLTIVIKFITGMCFASLTMCIAGIVESFRQTQWKADTDHSSLSIYAQLPQNIFMGFSEIFAMLASFEYAYFAAPRSAQTLFMSLRFCSLGISSFLASGYFAIFSLISSGTNFVTVHQEEQSWLFYTYFFGLAALQLIFIIIFILCQKKYEIIKLNPQQIQTNQFLQYPSTNRQ